MHYINYIAFLYQFLQEATSNNGPQIIIEMLANINLEKDLEMISKRGRIVVSIF